MNEKKLRAFRRGATANRWKETFKRTSMYVTNGNLNLDTVINSKGGGKTEVMIRVTENGFEELASKMMEANPEKALKAFGKAIQEYKL